MQAGGVGLATDERFPIGDINLNSSTMWLQLYQHQERQCAGGKQEPLEKQRGDEDEIRNTHTHTHSLTCAPRHSLQPTERSGKNRTGNERQKR